MLGMTHEITLSHSSFWLGDKAKAVSALGTEGLMALASVVPWDSLSQSGH